MDKMQAAPYHQQLLAMRAALLEQMADQRGGVVSRVDAATERFGRPEDPRAQMATERELEFALGERETAELAAIDAAIARIHAGNYGQCTSCGVDIAPARLHATPEASRCIQCQERAEHHRPG